MPNSKVSSKKAISSILKAKKMSSKKLLTSSALQSQGNLLLVDKLATPVAKDSQLKIATNISLPSPHSIKVPAGAANSPIIQNFKKSTDNNNSSSSSSSNSSSSSSSSTNRDLPSAIKSADHVVVVKPLIQAAATGLYSHKTFLVNKNRSKGMTQSERKQGKKHIWYEKKVDVYNDPKYGLSPTTSKVRNKILAESEVFAQELQRLILPCQPKTRILADGNDSISVISKEVPEFKALVLPELQYVPPSARNHIYNKTCRNFGAVVVNAFLLDEVDLKLGNIGYDGKDVTKIDGDQCFYQLRRLLEEKKLELTGISEADISALPLVINHRPNNWLGQVRHGVWSKNYDKQMEALSSTRSFREEVNKTILAWLLLPSESIMSLAKAHISDPSIAVRYTEYLSHRIQLLKSAALENTSFKNYIVTDMAVAHFKEIRENWIKFDTSGKNALIPIKEITMFFNNRVSFFDDLRKTMGQLIDPKMHIPSYAEIYIQAAEKSIKTLLQQSAAINSGLAHLAAQKATAQKMQAQQAKQVQPAPVEKKKRAFGLSVVESFSKKTKVNVSSKGKENDMQIDYLAKKK